MPAGERRLTRSGELHRGFARLRVAGIRLTGRGWGFLIAGLVARVAAYAVRRPELLYVAALLLALPVVAVVLIAIRRPELEITRSFAPDVVAVSRTTSARLSVRNRRLAPSARVVWWDVLPWAPWATDEAELPSLRGRAWPHEVTYTLRPPRRGVFAVGPFAAELTDPFHLATSLVAHGGEQQLIVTPEAVPLPESGLTVPAGSGEARLVQRRASGDEDDTMTREYRSGDAMRRVHWRASARHGELMVRQEEQRSLPRARILVDTLRDGYPDAADDVDEVETFEWVVRMLASVAVHLRRNGFHVDVHESAEPQLHVGARRTWGDEEFLAGLAAFGLRDHRDHGRADVRDEGPIIALLSDPDDETVAWMRRQRRPGTLAVAFVVLPLTGVDRLSRTLGGGAGASAAADPLTDDGWLVVPIRADEDHAAAWSAVVAETGRARGA